MFVQLKDWILVRSLENLFVRVEAPGDFKYALQTIRSCNKSKVDGIGIEFKEKLLW